MINFGDIDNDYIAGGYASNRSRTPSRCWTITPERKNCPVAAPIPVMLSPTVRAKTKRANDRYPNKEWIGYLIGKDDHETGVIVCHDMIIPLQVAHRESIPVVDFPLGYDIIGTIHSHHQFGAFISHQDEDYLVNNYCVSVVVSGDNMVANVRTVAPCGSYTNNETEIIDYGDYGVKTPSRNSSLLWRIIQYVIYSKGRTESVDQSATENDIAITTPDLTIEEISSIDWNRFDLELDRVLSDNHTYRIMEAEELGGKLSGRPVIISSTVNRNNPITAIVGFVKWIWRLLWLSQ